VPRRPLRLLHTADVHLDGDSYGTREERAAHRERGLQLFRRIVDRAVTDDVDLVLIAGDLFDHNRVTDETVAVVHAELRRLGRSVVILPGNHDALYPNAIYDRHDLTRDARHVHVIRRLDGEVVDLPGLEAMVWGRAMEEHEPAFSPLAGIPSRDRHRWCLAMGHGFFYEDHERPERSSPIFAGEIRDTGWDYLALGHQHVTMDVSQGAVTAYYAGAPIREGSDRRADGSLLRIDLSDAGGVRIRRLLLTP